jgi:leukotriene-A4 hydrolase
MKFVRPLYRALRDASDSYKQLALQTFAEHKAKYHPIARKMVATDLGAPL